MRTMDSEPMRLAEQDARNMERRRAYANRLWHFDEARFERAMTMRMPMNWFYRDRYTGKFRTARLG
jgi:hypothetical protein